jgi:F-type H+/Na+-transporting ATPase subunit alpha
MKQTAGSLRLDLAQYRELVGFSQFASDLDPATRRQLERGHRLMQLMKQGIHAPLPVAHQVAAIYAGVNGYLDDLPVSQVRLFEDRLNETLSASGADFTRLFAEKRAMTDEVKAALDALLRKLRGREV